MTKALGVGLPDSVSWMEVEPSRGTEAVMATATEVIAVEVGVGGESRLSRLGSITFSTASD